MEEQTLLQKARLLPLEPGVYLMLDKSGEVIYVGKAKKLRNRVSSYFIDSASHTPKTRMLISKIQSFDVILAASEFEALVLECSLIKRHMPRYNILLKDDKGYPYIRIDMNEPYPSFSVVGRIAQDGAEYFGPYGGRQTTQNAIRTVRSVMKLPDCSRKFPRDIGKERPCINYQMGTCEGWCLPEKTQTQHYQAVLQAAMILDGKYKQLAVQLKDEMQSEADVLHFERAAVLRDRLKAIERLGEKQSVTAGSKADTDAIGFYQGDVRDCFTVLHFVSGNLIDKDFELLEADPGANAAETLSTLIKQYYLRRGTAPNRVLLPVQISDAELFSQLLRQDLGKTVRFLVPGRGENLKLIKLAEKNAAEEAKRITTQTERVNAALKLLQTILALDKLPNRIEAYDVSNTAGTDIVGGMVVFHNGQPLKRDYRHFLIRDMHDQNDYASMVQMIQRRLERFQSGDRNFSELADLMLIDGGQAHAAAVKKKTAELGLNLHVVGMVKDDRHRTRALVWPDGREVGIAQTQAVFALIGTIQEETHRFAIEYHRKLRGRSMYTTVLQAVPGIGEKRCIALLRTFGSLEAVKQAGISDLEKILPKNTAENLYFYFHPDAAQSAENTKEDN